MFGFYIPYVHLVSIIHCSIFFVICFFFMFWPHSSFPKQNKNKNKKQKQKIKAKTKTPINQQTNRQNQREEET
jgi:hypothetical protein